MIFFVYLIVSVAKLEMSNQGMGIENVYTKNFYKTGGSKTYIPKNFYTKITCYPLLSEKFGASAAPTKLRPIYFLCIYFIKKRLGMFVCL
ncbi:hypothetical protein Hanom_Chr14g01314341 [Helianthus anomalus]